MPTSWPSGEDHDLDFLMKNGKMWYKMGIIVNKGNMVV
jgi:hypothetical protein